MTDARADPESESVETVNAVLKPELNAPAEAEAQAALVGAEVPKELKALTV
jgi:hypothetical protein